MNIEKELFQWSKKNKPFFIVFEGLSFDAKEKKRKKKLIKK